MGLTFNGVDLSAYGWTSPGVSGALDLWTPLVQEVDVPGRLHVDNILGRREYGTVVVSGFVEATTRAEFLSYWRSLKQALSPELGYKWLTRSDVSNRRILARCVGAQVVEERTPFTALGQQVEVQFDLLGPWEATTPTTATLTTTHTTVGELTAFPTWTCTATTGLSSGLSLTVNGHRFVYTGALVNADVVVVTTDPPNVTKNAARDIAHRGLGAVYPLLAPGVNSIRKNPSSGWTLGVSYYPRYE